MHRLSTTITYSLCTYSITISFECNITLLHLTQCLSYICWFCLKTVAKLISHTLQHNATYCSPNLVSTSSVISPALGRFDCSSTASVWSSASVCRARSVLCSNACFPTNPNASTAPCWCSNSCVCRGWVVHGKGRTTVQQEHRTCTPNFVASGRGYRSHTHARTHTMHTIPCHLLPAAAHSTRW